jgi:hypothetical protein
MLKNSGDCCGHVLARTLVTPNRSETYGLLKAVQSIDTGTGFEQSLSLGQAESTGSARDKDDLSGQAELGHAALGTDGGSLLLDRDDGSSGFNGDRHGCDVRCMREVVG